MKDTPSDLSALRRMIDARLVKFFRDTAVDLKKRGSPSPFLDLHRRVAEFTLRGGKRLRSILMYYGYLAAGGTEQKRILDASICIELIHNYLLAHDDIMDRDKMRRNGPTLHTIYEKAVSRKSTQPPTHYGISMGILAGDLLSAYGYGILTGANFPAERKIEAIHQLNEMLSVVTEGQVLDVACIATDNAVTLSGILRIITCKTARYSTEGPLRLGAVLAGASHETLRALRTIALPLGMAYQLQDDLLRLFSDAETLGKESASDIRENKATVPVFFALRNGTATDRKSLRHLLGRVNLTAKDVRDFGGILHRSGAVIETEKLIKNYILQSRRALNVSATPPIAHNGLSYIIDYVEKRES